MGSIRNIEIIKEKMGFFQASALAYIVSLKYQSENDNNSSEIIIDGLMQMRNTTHAWPMDEKSWFLISIKFIGINNFKINGLGSTPKQVMGFDIVDISDRGWENINFQIEDYEDDSIGFYCKEICILSVEEYKK